MALWCSPAFWLASSTWRLYVTVAHSPGERCSLDCMVRSSNMEPSSTKARSHPMAPWAVWLDRHCRTRLLRMLLSACLASSATTAPSSSRGSLSPVGPLNGAGSLLQLCCYQLAWLASRNWCLSRPAARLPMMVLFRAAARSMEVVLTRDNGSLLSPGANRVEVLWLAMTTGFTSLVWLASTARCSAGIWLAPYPRCSLV
jgi:hypothetical protein